MKSSRSWQALNETEPDYSAKHFQDLMETLEITESDKLQIISAYDKVLAAYKAVLITDKECADMMMKKTHFLSYIAFAEWIIMFYKNPPEKYLGASNQQTTSIRHIRARVEAVREAIDKFLK